MRQPPVVLLAFPPSSHPRADAPPRHVEEAHLLRAVLAPAHDQGRIRLVVCEGATLDDLLRVFDRYRGQVAIFHFAGHTDEDSPLLNKLLGLNGRPPALRDQPGLKLVFLNARSGQGQANTLHAAGIPAVITATGAAPDDACPVFALRFYRALAAGDSIAAAFAKAHEAALWEEHAQYGAFAPGLWQLSTPELAAGEWRLPAAALPAARLGVAVRKLMRRQTEAERAASDRREMLRRVRAIWIDGVLAQSPQLTSPPALAQRQPGGGEQLLATGTDIAALFSAAHESLVILGAPGAGKSTLLLQLTEALLARCTTDEFAPIPVVLNLATWQPQEQFIDEWVSEQLWRLYHVPPNVTARWLDADALAWLLDGLDEMAADRRDAAVAEFNALLAHRRRPPLALCCGEQEYAALAHPVGAETVLRVLPLTDEQVRTRVEQVGGENAAHVATLLAQDAALRQAAASPLLLDMMLAAAGELQPAPAPTEAEAPPAAQPAQAQVFDAYLRAMLHDPPGATSKPPAYPPATTARRLHWLAAKLTRQGQPILLLEQMGKGWLNTPRQWRNWRIIAGVVFGFCLALLYAIVFGFMFASALPGVRGPAGEIGGLLLLMQLLLAPFTALGIWGFYAVISGVVLGVLFGAAGSDSPPGPPMAWNPDMAAPWFIRWLGVAAVAWILTFGVIFAAAFSLPWEMCWLLVGLGACLLTGVSIWQAFGIPVFSTALAAGYPVQSPAAGLRRLLRSGLAAGLLLGLCSAALGTLGMLVMPLFRSISAPEQLWLVAGAYFGLGVGLGVALCSGAAIFPGHYLLRYQLWRDGSIPLRLVRFLNHCADRRLLHHVGPGYSFIHPAFQEYLSSKEL